MSDSYTPPQTRLDEPVAQELGWSSFGHMRRIAIVTNGLGAVLLFLLGLLIFFQEGSISGMFDGIFLALLFLLGFLSLWRYRRQRVINALAALGALYILVLVFHTVWKSFPPQFLNDAGPLALARDLTGIVLLVLVCLPPVSLLCAQAIAWKQARDARLSRG